MQIKNILLVVGFTLLAWLLLDYQAVDQQHTLTIGGPFEFTSQDLSKDGFMYTRMQVAEALVDVEHDGSLVPKLASDWQVNDNGLEWRFSLRPDVSFHDGRPLNADAVVYSLRQAIAKPGVVQQLPLERLYADAEQVVVELSRPYKPLLSILAHYSLAILSPSSYDEQGQVVALSGTGPYQVALLAPPHKLNVRRFPEYWGEAASIEQVHYLTGHRAESRALQAQSGQADLIYTLDPASLDLLERADNVWVHSQSIPRTVLLKLNNAHPYLNNKQTRQALSLALDREGLSEHVVRVPDSAAYQLFPPALGHWHLSELAEKGRNLALAGELLKQQGWQMGSDGVLEREGERFRLNLVTYADRPELTVLATAIQAQLAEIGVEVEVVVDNSSSIPARHHDGTLELALIARNYGTLSDPLALLVDDHLQGGGDWGPMNWSSPALSELLESLMSSDGEQDQLLTRQAAQLLADELPLIPVLFYTQQVAVNQRVQNFQFDPFELNYRVAEMSFAN